MIILVYISTPYNVMKKESLLDFDGVLNTERYQSLLIVNDSVGQIATNA